MTKWEYKDVKIFCKDITNPNQTQPSYVFSVTENGKKVGYSIPRIKNWFSNLYACPNFHGKEEWELIKMGQDVGLRWFLFKRELQ